MRKEKKRMSSLIKGAVLALAIKALASKLTQAVQTARPTAGNASYETIDAFVEDQMRRLHIPGAALAIVEGDRMVHLRGFGRARPEGEVPTPQTPFFIGSLTKSLTALAVMQLVEAGMIELDAPVQRYLPWFRVSDAEETQFPAAPAAMTVRHLLNQTSGLPMLRGMTNLSNMDSRPGAVERQARALSTLRLNHPPGAVFEYSNLNYNLLGLIVEAASGEGYAGYILRHIFDPLEMRHSYTSKAAAKENGLAAGHRHWFGVPIPAPNLPVPQGSLPSGQLISTTEDMAHYLIAQLNGGCYNGVQILSSAGIDELHHPAAEIIELGTSFGSYGMGWISEGTGASRIVSHSGIVPDYGGFMAIVPEQNRGFVLLFNANHAMLKMTLDELGMRVAQRLAGLPPEPFKSSAVVWLMRGLLLVPLLQAAGVAATLRQVSRWRREPALRPSQGRMWQQHIILPILPNLSFVGALLFLLKKRMFGFLRLFMPDAYWMVLIGGAFAGVWAFLRTGLILKTLRKP